jgi:radical SAM/Cys-rich protein
MELYMNAFEKTVRQHLGKNLFSDEVRTVQVNLGLRCNLGCRHCHVEGGPERKEVMAWPTMESVLRLGAHFPGCLFDLTGGAPELNPHFTRFVDAACRNGHPVQVRTNLTVLFEPGMKEMADFYRSRQVQVVASLPCYLAGNVSAQRGPGVYEKSIAALRRLNELGYGRNPRLTLSLVYNPGGAFLPPGQANLEADYRRHLQDNYGVEFTRLFTITNMPIGRFMDDLRRQGKGREYQRMLEEAFNPHTVEGLMCRHQICVAWDGTLTDCDFNQALGQGLEAGLPKHIDQLDPARLRGRRIVTGEHCFGCTAGCGSSCGGALVA